MTQNNNGNIERQLTNFMRVDFKVDNFDLIIHQKGANVTWQKSALCSCINTKTGQSDYNCPACKGKGYIYFDDTKIRAVVSGITGDKSQIPIGLLDVGTSYLTTKSTDLVGFRDRIIFEDFRTAYSEVATCIDNEVELRYECENLVAVHVLSTALPLDKISISEDKTKLIIDPEVGIQNGERVSLLYHIKPVYIVIDIPHELRGTYVKFGYKEEQWKVLPKQLMIKREDLLTVSMNTMGGDY